MLTFNYIPTLHIDYNVYILIYSNNWKSFAIPLKHWSVDYAEITKCKQPPV